MSDIIGREILKIPIGQLRDIALLPNDVEFVCVRAAPTTIFAWVYQPAEFVYLEFTHPIAMRILPGQHLSFGTIEYFLERYNGWKDGIST